LRKLKVAATLTVLSVGLLSAVAVAGAATKFPPNRVGINVQPKHRLHAPFTYRVHGRVVPPNLQCASTGTSIYCIPCPTGSSACTPCPPSGVSTSSYCIPSPPVICNGNVRITARLTRNGHLPRNGLIVRRKTVRLRSDCTYGGKITIPTNDLRSKTHLTSSSTGRFERIRVTARFLGNSVLTAKSSRTVIVHARVINLP
jgi:hypothetical protein